MPHYICKGGCKGVSDIPGVCENEDCASHNHQFEACDCEDGKHHGAFGESVPAEEDTLKEETVPEQAVASQPEEPVEEVKEE